MTDDVRPLRDELHDLAGGVASTANATGRARERTRRGIVRHRRNQRAAVACLATVVLVAGVTAAVALGRDSRHSAPPAGPTTVAPSTAATTTTTSAPTSSRPAGPITSTIPTNVPTAVELSARHFSWGTGPGQVAFHTPTGEGASGGPVAFSANADGKIVMLDHSNARLVDSTDVWVATPIPDLSPAVTAAVFDSKGRVIVATVTDLAVYGSDGKPQGAWPNLATDAITRLVIQAANVYSVAEDGLTTLLLRGTASGYAVVPQGSLRAAPVSAQRVGEGDDRIGFNTPADSPAYVVTVGSFVDVRAVRLLADGSLVFVLGQRQSAQSNPDTEQPYTVGRVTASGVASYELVHASRGYLTSGPVFNLNDDGIAVMSSTTTVGVTVAYYEYP